MLGAEELRELLDAEVLADLEPNSSCWSMAAELDADELHDVLRRLGPLSRLDLEARSVDRAPVETWIRSCWKSAERSRCASRTTIDSLPATAQPAAMLWGGASVGLPAVFTDPVDDPLGDLCRRYARTHGPFRPRRCPLVGYFGDPFGRCARTARLDGDLLGGVSARWH